MQHIILAYNVNKDTFLANVVLATAYAVHCCNDTIQWCLLY